MSLYHILAIFVVFPTFSLLHLWWWTVISDLWHYCTEYDVLKPQMMDSNFLASSVQLLSHVPLFATPWTRAHQASLSITNSGAYPNSCPLSRWCHLTISSSVVPFSSCLQSFPASGSFPMSQFFASSGQNIGVSASTSVLPVNTQDWSPLGWTGWISLQPHSSKASILRRSAPNLILTQFSGPGRKKSVSL